MPTSPAHLLRTFSPRLVHGVLAGFVFFLVWWFKTYLTSDPVPAWDLPGHIVVAERLREVLLYGHVVFYDPAWFGGWAALAFYAPLGAVTTAILSFPLGILSEEPVRLAAQLILVFGCVLLPVTMYYCGRVFLAPHLGATIRERNFIELPYAFSVCCLSFWFLNHDEQWYGIGAASVMNVGLFSQVFGWHALLYYFAAHSLVVQGERRGEFHIALAVFLLLIGHTLTTAFAFGIGLLAFSWFSERRIEIFRGHILGIMLSAFWLFPFFAYSGTYVGLDIYRPTGDFLQLLFRYPLYLVWRVRESLFSLDSPGIDWNNLFMFFGVLAFLVNAKVRKLPFLVPLSIGLVLLVLAFSSGFVASSLPIGLHYYRFLAYAFLGVVFIVSFVPAIMFSNLSSTAGWKSGVGMFVGAALVMVSVLSTIAFPHYERERIAECRGKEHLANEEQVIDYFSRLPNKGRVFIEYNTDGNRFAFLSPHYIESQLFRRTGFETWNGLYIQGSLAYRMAVMSANMLGAKTYNIPLLFTDHAKVDDATLVKQLREFGVTHIVSGQDRFAKRVLPFAQGEVEKIGPYTITTILPAVAPKISRTTKAVVGVFSLEGDLRFEHLEYYFHSRAKLYQQFDLIHLHLNQAIPEQVRAVIVNTAEDAKRISENLVAEKRKDINLIALEFQEPLALDHYNVRYQHNVELDAYNELEKVLEAKNLFSILEPLIELPDSQLVKNVPADSPEFHWDPRYQSFRLRQVEPRQLYRIDYSYFPYWASSEADVFRGSGERIFVVPHKAQVQLRFSPFSRPVVWLGCLLTLGGAIWLWMFRGRLARPTGSR